MKRDHSEIVWLGVRGCDCSDCEQSPEGCPDLANTHKHDIQFWSQFGEK